MADKLISADALLKRICELCGENCEMPNEAVTCIEWEFTHDAIESLPPVDTVPKAYYDNLLKRFKHLIQSDYIRSFDAWDSRKNTYVLDIRDAEPMVWIPITSRPMDDEERLEWSEKLGYDLDDDEALIYTSLPDDGEEVLVCGRYGSVWIDKFMNDPDYGCWFEENGDMEGIVAWMPLPKPYRERSEDER